MKKGFTILAVLTLIVMLAVTFAGCSLFEDIKDKVDDAIGGEEKITEWTTADVTMFSGDIVAWSADKDGDSYKVFLDGEEIGTTKQEYFELPETEVGLHKIVVESEYDGKKYRSAEKEFSKTNLRELKITDIEALDDYLSEGKYRLGSLQYNAVTLDFSEAGSSSVTLNYPLSISASLERLTVIGRPSLTISGFRADIEDRQSPLTIVLKNCSLSSYTANMFNYSGETDFDTHLLAYGKSSFSNTFRGANGADGRTSSEIDDVKGEKGGKGGNGGSIFRLPELYMFAKTNPSFITGDGGDGGDGGRGIGFMHGGNGGNGGNGGYVFNDCSVICFNAYYGEYKGSYGSGGMGGRGADGFTTGKNGSNGSSGALMAGSSYLKYLSRQDGVDPDAGDKGDGNFNLSYFNGMLVWNEQEGATSYNIMVDGSLFATSPMNCYYIGDISASATLGKAEIKVEAVGGAEENAVSDSLKVFGEEEKYVVTEATSDFTGHEYIEIDASLLKGVSEINIAADVLRFSIVNAQEQKINLYLNINAASRSENLILDLENVTITGKANKATVSLNDGVGSSAATDPLLIINADKAEIYGKTGEAGKDGSNASGFAIGEDGGDGKDGYAAILSAQVFIGGKNAYIKGGDGGRGGNGGSATGNDGGDGGNGGDGVAAISCNNCYVAMTTETDALVLRGGSAGSKGLRGESNALNGAKDGNDGASGKNINGTLHNYSGSIS